MRFKTLCGLVVGSYVALAVTMAAGAQAKDGANPNLLVSPAWLAEHQKDANLVLLHVGEPKDFPAEHIPGAQLIELRDIATGFGMENKSLTLELPEMAQLQEAFEKRGISNNSRVVVYFGKDWYSPSTRVIWTLTYVGLGDRVSLLDGGMPAWKAAGHAVTAEVKTPARGHLTITEHPEILVKASWLADHVRKPDVALMDARGKEDWAGSRNPRNMSRVGHIPGAASLPMEALVAENGNLKSAAELNEIFSAAGAKRGSRVVSYCYVGQRATVLWFSARMLGYDAALYDGSWDEWSKHDDWPIDGPAKAETKQ